MWKRRFPVLSNGIRTKVQTTLTTIIATAVLHNMLVRANEPLPINDIILNEDVLQQVSVLPIGQTGNTIRRNLIDAVFN